MTLICTGRQQRFSSRQAGSSVDRTATRNSFIHDRVVSNIVQGKLCLIQSLTIWCGETVTSILLLYMKCSDVIVITRRHVGGILTVNKNIAKMRKSENSYANVIRRPCFFWLRYNSTRNS